MDISESVAFILSHKPTMIERFYKRFLNDYPEVRPYFVGIDLAQQALMLTMALIVVEAHYACEYPATRHYLHVLGHRHRLANVRPEHYPLFRDCLLQTLAEIHQDRWSDELARQWRAAIDKTVATMLEGYDEPYVY